MDPSDEALVSRLTRLVDGIPHHPAPSVTGSSSRPRRQYLSWLGAGVSAAAMVGVILAVVAISAALRAGGTGGPGSGSVTDGVLRAGGLRLTYPSQWHAYLVSAGGGSFTYQAVISTDELKACGEDGLAIDIDCALEQPLSSGAVRLLIGYGGIPGFAFKDLEPPDGWELVVDGQPAVVEVEGPAENPSSDMTVTWRIAHPAAEDNFYMLTALMREPGLVERRAELDELVRTITFESVAE